MTVEGFDVCVTVVLVENPVAADVVVAGVHRPGELHAGGGHVEGCQVVRLPQPGNNLLFLILQHLLLLFWSNLVFRDIAFPR